MKIEIMSEQLKETTIAGKKGDFTIKKQTGYLHNGKAYPQECQFRVDKPYPPGMYTVLDDSFFIGKYQELSVGSLKLAPSK